MTEFEKNKYDQQSGRNMIEMLAVIVLVGMLTIGGLAGIRQGWFLWQHRVVFEQTEELADQVIGLTRWQRYVGPGFDVQTMACENEVFPSDCNDEGVYENQFGGQTRLSFRANGQLAIEWTQMPPEVCEWLICDARWVQVTPEKSCDELESACAEDIPVVFLTRETSFDE